MNTEIKSIIRSLESSLDGEPWFGRPVYALLREVKESVASVKPNKDSHSLIELLYHMNTWADFTLKRIQKDHINDMAAFDKLDWREIDPLIHGWEEGLSLFIATNQHILALLGNLDDKFLDEKVEYRDYDFRYLLRGYIDHNIYHAGQIAYLNKLL